jgi:hypothetical protein
MPLNSHHSFAMQIVFFNPFGALHCIFSRVGLFGRFGCSSACHSA